MDNEQKVGNLGVLCPAWEGLYQSLRDLPGHYVTCMWLIGLLSNLIPAINYGGSASR